MSYEPAFARYDLWLQSGADAMSTDGGWIEGYPVKCSECGDRVHANQGAEELADQPHEDCRDEDTGEAHGFYRVEADYDFRDDDPRL